MEHRLPSLWGKQASLPASIRQGETPAGLTAKMAVPQPPQPFQ